MEITEAHNKDIAAIVQLLKDSLGETLTPKSENYWRWKHEDNIFGPSKVIVAKENDQIIGVRAFMKWQWVNETDSYSAVRAVDTATHPDFQGKGIFKKLTMQAIAESKADGISMVFNTPNSSSKPGYLKMGWKEAGRLPLFFKMGSIFPKKYSIEYVNDIMESFSMVSQLENLPANFQVPVIGHAFQTQIDFSYLKWRYADCPVAKYGMVIQPNKFGFVFRLKKINSFIELRICDIWLQSDANKNELNASIIKTIRSVRPLVVSSAPSVLLSKMKKNIKGFWGPFSKGPVVTVRNLSEENLSNFDLSKNWLPSLGAMELF